MFKFLSTLLMAFAIALLPAAGAAETRSEAKTKVKPKEQVKTRTRTAKVKTRQIARVGRDVERLESLLAGVKTSAKLSDKSWRSVSNEANMLADRIYANVKSANAEKDAVRAAEQLRNHVRQMKKKAHQGDYRQTRRHAARALAVAYRLDEWAG